MKTTKKDKPKRRLVWIAGVHPSLTYTFDTFDFWGFTKRNTAYIYLYAAYGHTHM